MNTIIKIIRQSLLGICLIYCLSIRSNATLENLSKQSTSIAIQEIFEYTKHGYQNYLVPQDTSSLQIDAWGGSGADVGTILGGFGHYISTNISVIPGQILYVYVGKRGTRSNETLINDENGEDTEIRLQKDNMDSRIVVACGGQGAHLLPWSVGSNYVGASIENGIAVGTTGNLFGDVHHSTSTTGSHSFTTGRQLFSQDGVRHGHGKVIIRRHRSQQDRFLQITIPQHQIYLPLVMSPSFIPSGEPTVRPTIPPTINPSTFFPTIKPTMIPTLFPTLFPTKIPTQQPTSRPSRHPSRQPTGRPTHHPSSQPSRQPANRPTGQPSSQPTRQPTRQPVGRPTSQPSCQPSRQPTMQPSRYQDILYS